MSERPSIVKNSPLRYASFVEEVVEGEKIGWWEPITLEPYVPQTTDTFHEVRDGDRIDRLAYQFYGDPRYQWALMWANDLGLPDVELVSGFQLRVPSKRYLLNNVIKGG